VVKVGDKLRVEIADIDNRGKISLVLVAEDAEAGAADAPADAATDVTTDTGAEPADAATASN
jgi:polyribonucleotide nucleotidyltransferase